MACCLSAPSHYLNQCWLIIIKVQRHSSEGNFTIDTSAINHWNYLTNYLSKISFKFPRGQWVKWEPYVVNKSWGYTPAMHDIELIVCLQNHILYKLYFFFFLIILYSCTFLLFHLWAACQHEFYITMHPLKFKNYTHYTLYENIDIAALWMATYSLFT